MSGFSQIRVLQVFETRCASHLLLRPPICFFTLRLVASVKNVSTRTGKQGRSLVVILYPSYSFTPISNTSSRMVSLPPVTTSLPPYCHHPGISSHSCFGDCCNNAGPSRHWSDLITLAWDPLRCFQDMALTWIPAFHASARASLCALFSGLLPLIFPYLVPSKCFPLPPWDFVTQKAPLN